MKKFLAAIAIAMLFSIASCSKKESLEQIQKPDTDFGKLYFAGGDRDVVYDNPAKTARALAKFGNKTLEEAMESATANQPFYVYASIYGDTVNNANWNGGNQFIVTMADTNLIKQALENTRRMYSMFPNVIVTTNKALWEAAGPSNRIKIIVGNCTVLGPYLGYAWINCFLWQDDTPSFVNVNNCNQLNLLADIGYGITHEGAHMLGRPHQYAYGGSGFKSWATVMGNWYGKTFITWTKEDIQAFELIFGEIIDDYPNTPQTWVYKPENVGKPFAGFLKFNDVGDVCRIKGSGSSQTNIIVRTDGGWPIVINIYNANKVLKQTANTLQSFSKNFTIPKGNTNWYVEVKSYYGGVFPAGYGSTSFSSTGFTQQ